MFLVPPCCWNSPAKKTPFRCVDTDPKMKLSEASCTSPFFVCAMFPCSVFKKGFGFYKSDPLGYYQVCLPFRPTCVRMASVEEKLKMNQESGHGKLAVCTHQKRTAAAPTPRSRMVLLDL